MKNLLKKTVPAVLALLLLITPTATVLAAEPLPTNSLHDNAQIVAKVLEEEPADDAAEPNAANPEAPADTAAQTPDAAAAPQTNTATGQPDANFNHVWPTPAAVETESVLVLENSTSSVLYEKDADTMRYPASTTKILTCLIAIENSEMNEVVTFSETACELEAGATSIYAEPGEQMYMKDVLYGLMLPSGNDCANAIAEHIAGSTEAFAEMMNARAAEIGCTASHFSNPHGLFESDHYTTARDLALIAQAAFNNSTFVNIISTPSYHVSATNMHEERTWYNTNLLIDEDSDYYYPAAIGGKTGYLDEAGRCLVSFASYNGINVISVQLKGGYTQIFGEAQTLLNFAFDNFMLQNASANERRFSYPVEGAKVMLDPASQILALRNIPFEQLESEVIFAEDLSVDQKAHLQLTANEAAGRTLYAVINYSYAGHVLGSVNVYLDPQLVVTPAAFTTVKYINPLYLAIFVVLVLVLIFAFYGTTKAKKKAAPQVVQRRQPHSNEDYYEYYDDEVRKAFDETRRIPNTVRRTGERRNTDPRRRR